MATKPVTAGSARVSLPAERDAGAAADAPAAGGAASPKAAQAATKPDKAAKTQSASRPGSSAGSQMGKAVDKALGKTPRPTSSAAPAAQKSSAGYATSATAAAAGEWGFLSDKNVSIEDKLFRFLMLAQKKNDAELVKKMEEYKARFTAEGKAVTTGGGSKGSSLFDAVKAFVPVVGLAEKLIGEAGIKKLVGQIAGPALAAAATAAGMPALAPLALQLGGSLASMAFQDTGAKAATSSKADANSPDERVAMFELQRLAEKQQAMFTAISNTLKCMHDTQMSAIHNIR